MQPMNDLPMRTDKQTRSTLTRGAGPLLPGGLGATWPFCKRCGGPPLRSSRSLAPFGTSVRVVRLRGVLKGDRKGGLGDCEGGLGELGLSIGSCTLCLAGVYVLTRHRIVVYFAAIVAQDVASYDIVPSGVASSALRATRSFGMAGARSLPGDGKAPLRTLLGSRRTTLLLVGHSGGAAGAS